jgi:quercetin dioxygenase-like cupin family protein
MPFIDTREIPVKEPLPGWKGRFFNSLNMTFAHYDVAAGAAIHPHSHPNEEVWHIVEGDFEVTIGGTTEVAGPGSVAVIPPDTIHSVKALTEGRAIVVDHPLRASIGGIRVS